MLNITRDTGELLAVLVHARGARRVLEIGTSNGYSTLWLARAARSLGGSVVTVEKAQDKFDMGACELCARAIARRDRPVAGGRGRRAARCGGRRLRFYLPRFRAQQYALWWPQLDRALAAGGVLVVDNASSHYADMADFIETIRADSRYTTCLATVGKGEFITVKSGN